MTIHFWRSRKTLLYLSTSIIIPIISVKKLFIYLSIPCRWFLWAKHLWEISKGSSHAFRPILTRICWESSSSKCSLSSASFESSSDFQKEMSPTRCLKRSPTSLWSCFYEEILLFGVYLTANIFESGPMPTSWKFLNSPPLLPSCELG